MNNLNRQQFEGLLRNELGVSRGRKQARHPRSGWPIDVGVRRVPIEGSSPPEVQVLDAGHFPGRGPTPLVMGKGTDLGRKPLKYVYRGVSEEDYQGIQKSGFMKSDGRMNISEDEGTVAATNPGSAGWYLPHGKDGALAPGRVLKVRVHPDDGWRIDTSDAYVKTNRPIPLGRVVRATAPIYSDEHGSKYR